MKPKLNFEVDSLVGKNNNLLVLGEERIKGDTKVYRKILVKCLICAKDPELNGEAVYSISPTDLNSGNLPCKCSHIPKHTQKQWTIILERKAKERNYEITFTGEHLNQTVKLQLHCRTCGNNWNSCSVGNFLKDRTCPRCAGISKATLRRLPESKHAEDFIATGVFKEGTVFEKVNLTGRLWRVTCPLYPGKEFFSDKSNLKAGKLPCDCNNGGGFDKKMDGYVYILKAQSDEGSFVGYGITNFPKRRKKDHERELGKQGYSIVKYNEFKFNGVLALQIEAELKFIFDLFPQKITGFKREATYTSNYAPMLGYLSTYPLDI